MANKQLQVQAAIAVVSALARRPRAYGPDIDRTPEEDEIYRASLRVLREFLPREPCTPLPIDMLSLRARKALERAGITTAEALQGINRIQYEHLWEVRQCGPTTMHEIAEYLKASTGRDFAAKGN